MLIYHMGALACFCMKTGSIDFLFIVTPIVGVYNCSMFYVLSSIAIILMGKRQLVALLNLSSWFLVMVEWLFLAVPWGCLQFVIVVFPEHTHLLFLTLFYKRLFFLSFFLNLLFQKIFSNTRYTICLDPIKILYLVLPDLGPFCL